MKLWLDDSRKAPEGWTWYTCPWKALRHVLALEANITEWSLDHDLGPNTPSGYDFISMILLLIDRGLKVHVPDNVGLHSMNPVGRDNMVMVLKEIRRRQHDSTT